MKTVSVIIPVYNAEQHIAKCLDSILSQSYNDYEIILVNDGSIDNSFRICKSYEERNECIKVLTQKNKGCSVARNAGIEHANGKYVFFVDVDDTLDCFALQDLFECAEKENADIVVGTVNTRNNPSNDYIILDSQNAMSVCINRDRCIETYSFPKYVYNINPGSPWMKLIRRDLLEQNNIRFPVDVRTHHEDTLFCMDVYAKADRIVLLDSNPYFYNIGVKDSLCNKFYIKKIDEAIILINHMITRINEYVKKDNRDIMKSDFVREVLLECWSDYFTHPNNRLCTKEKRNALNALIEENMVNSILKELDYDGLKIHQILVIKCMRYRKITLLMLMAFFQRHIKSR